MLDVIKQLMPLKTIQDRPAVEPAGRSGHDNAMFQKLMVSSEHSSPAARLVNHAEKDARSSKADDDRPDLASGWQTADSSAYESAQSAPTRPEVRQSEDKSSDDDLRDRGSEDTVSLTGEAGQANQPAEPCRDASADSGAQADQSDQAGQVAGQGTAAPSSGAAQSSGTGPAVAQSAVQFGMANMLSLDAAQAGGTQSGVPQPAPDADAAAPTGSSSSTAAGAAPATEGGTPVQASTDASGPAVLSASSDPIVSDGGQSIETQVTADPARVQRNDRPEDRPARQATPKATAPSAGEAGSSTASVSANAQATEGQAVMSPAVQAAGRVGPAEPGGQAPEKARPTGESASPAVAPVSSGADLLAGAVTNGAQADSGVRIPGSMGLAVGPHGRGSAGDAQGAQQASNLPTPDTDNLAARTVRWQRLGMLDNQGIARIRLDPPELGSVQVSMRTVDNQVTIQMTVDTESVRQLLQSNSDRLVQSLQAQGFQTTRIEVVVQTPAQESPQQGGNQGGQSNGGQQNPQQHQQSRQQDRPFAQQMREELNLTA